MGKEGKTMKKWKKRLLIPGIVLAGAAVAFIIYVSDYYHSEVVVSYGERDGIQIQAGENYIEFLPGEKEADTAFVFYPGAKVEYTSYAPLMERLAGEGIACYLMHMPCNLAVLDMNSADEIRREYDYDNWYVGGHSLGGAMAAAYVSKNAEDYDGLVLLGAYSTKDLSDSGLKVLSIYGSEDGVLNREKYEEDKDNLPAGFSELEIPGGNHAYYGAYGEQKGDGHARITPEEQQEETAGEILDWMEE